MTSSLTRLLLMILLALLVGASQMQAKEVKYYFVTIPAIPKIAIKVVGTDRLDALIRALNPTVWTEEEWIGSEVTVRDLGIRVEEK